jgi:hypothetical protein
MMAKTVCLSDEQHKLLCETRDMLFRKGIKSKSLVDELRDCGINLTSLTFGQTIAIACFTLKRVMNDAK